MKEEAKEITITYMSSTTGKAISAKEDIKQSIKDIITTPIGTRVMRREYGCRLFEFIDAPMNHMTMGYIKMSIISALENYEPRITVSQVEIQINEQNKLELQLNLNLLEE